MLIWLKLIAIELGPIQNIRMLITELTVCLIARINDSFNRFFFSSHLITMRSFLGHQQSVNCKTQQIIRLIEIIQLNIFDHLTSIPRWWPFNFYGSMIEMINRFNQNVNNNQRQKLNDKTIRKQQLTIS